MQKTIIAAIVGGIILFIWQFLSWTVLNLHLPANQYTPNQQAIMSALEQNLPEEGGYMIPTVPPGSSSEEYQNLMTESEGKPWATIQYHKAMDTGMAMNMIRGLLTNIIIVWLLCWMLMRMNAPTFGTILTASLFTGLIVFLNGPYTGSIWYDLFDIMAHFYDAIISWIACGLWLGWWLTRKR